MNKLFTPDRAERLARVMEGDGHTVKRYIEQRNVIGTREVDGLTILIRVYAIVLHGATVLCQITYETIDPRSNLL